MVSQLIQTRFLQLIRPGRSGEIFVVLAAFVIVLVTVYLTSRGWKAFLRRLPIVDGIEAAVGRCAEMGRPVFFSSILGTLDKTEAAQTLASLSTLGYVAKLAARYDVPIIVGVGVPETIPLIDDIVRGAFTEEGKLEKYRKEETIRFLAPDQWGFSSAVMGTLRRNPTGANVMIGEMRGDTLMYFEPGAETGSLQIGGTSTMSNLQWVAVATDYSAIGEEVFALAAYVSKDPVLTNTLFGEDLVKFGLIAYVLAGILLAAGGSDLLVSLLRM